MMEKFNRTYGHYPKYPVADAGYGSYNNYLYCEEPVSYTHLDVYKRQLQGILQGHTCTVETFGYGAENDLIAQKVELKKEHGALGVRCV